MLNENSHKTTRTTLNVYLLLWSIFLCDQETLTHKTTLWPVLNCIAYSQNTPEYARLFTHVGRWRRRERAIRSGICLGFNCADYNEGDDDDDDASEEEMGTTMMLLTMKIYFIKIFILYEIQIQFQLHFRGLNSGTYYV